MEPTRGQLILLALFLLFVALCGWGWLAYGPNFPIH